MAEYDCRVWVAGQATARLRPAHGDASLLSLSPAGLKDAVMQRLKGVAAELEREGVHCEFTVDHVTTNEVK